MSTALNVAPLSGKIGVGNYILEIIPIDGGYRLTAKRGKEIQTMDVMNGIGIEKFEKINSTGDADNYRITFTDNSAFEFSIETNAKTYAAAETERINAEQVRMQNEAERVSSETTRKNTFAGYQGEIDKFKTEIVTSKDAVTENTRIAIGEVGEALEVPSMEEFNGLKDDLSQLNNVSLHSGLSLNFVLGTRSASNGAFASTTTCATIMGFIAKNVVLIDFQDTEYSCRLFAWDKNENYVGAWDGNQFTSATIMFKKVNMSYFNDNYDGYSYRLVVVKDDNTEITVDNINPNVYLVSQLYSDNVTRERVKIPSMWKIGSRLLASGKYNYTPYIMTTEIFHHSDIFIDCVYPYKVALFAWDSNGNYLGGWNGSSFSDSIAIKYVYSINLGDFDNTYSYALVAKDYVNNSEMNINDNIYIVKNKFATAEELSALTFSAGNQWKGKLWYAYGTSLTEQGKYTSYLAELSGATLVNKGTGGGALVANRIIYDALMDNADGKINADLITIEVGANDRNAPLGTPLDLTNTTFCGALNLCLKNIIQNCTRAQVILMDSTRGRYPYGGGDNYTLDEQTPGGYSYLEQAEAIKQVAKINGIYYIPFGSLGLGLYRMQIDDSYIVDNIHYTDLGGYNQAVGVWGYLKNIPNWYITIPN